MGYDSVLKQNAAIYKQVATVCDKYQILMKDFAYEPKHHIIYLFKELEQNDLHSLLHDLGKGYSIYMIGKSDGKPELEIKSALKLNQRGEISDLLTEKEYTVAKETLENIWAWTCMDQQGPVSTGLLMPKDIVKESLEYICKGKKSKRP
jgi:hypothetical protein